MHIQQEIPENHTIRSYDEQQITIGEVSYPHSLIISKQTIINPWSIKDIHELDENSLQPMLPLKPDIIIIGHASAGFYMPINVMSYLSKQGIGIECMSIGAACRTFNILLNEERHVVAGIILKTAEKS